MALKSVEIKILDPRVGNEYASPAFQTAGSAALDLVACTDKDIVLQPGSDSVLVPTGISVFVKDPDYAALILPRSGSGHRLGLVLGNLTGLIDSDYQGQLMVSAWNRHSLNTIIIAPGERIAQLMFVPVEHPEFKFVTEFSNNTVRGEGGFGSTGKH